MRDKKLLTLLRSLDEKELREFGKYLSKTRGNKQVALRTFSYLKKCYPHFDDPKKMASDRMVRKVFGVEAVGRENARKNLLNVFHYLYSWLKEFLLLQKVKDKSIESDWLWLCVLREKGLKEEVRKNFLRLHQKIGKNPKRDTMDYLLSMALEHFHSEESGNESPGDLNALCLELDSFYKISRTKIDCEIVNRKNISGQVPAGLADALNGFHPGARQPLSTVYESILKMLRTGSEKAFAQAVASMRKNADHLSKRELNAVYTYLKNFCGAKIGIGKSRYLQTAHELDLYALEQALFTGDGGYLSDVQFLNVVDVATKAGKFSWTEKFIVKYKKQLSPDDRYELGIMAVIMLQFARRNYREVLRKMKVFEKHRSKHAERGIRVRSMKIMAMYELGYDDIELFNELASFKNYLRRASTPRKDLLKKAAGFNSVFLKILVGKKDKELIRQEIEAARVVPMNKSWLLDKLKGYRPGR